MMTEDERQDLFNKSVLRRQFEKWVLSLNISHHRPHPTLLCHIHVRSVTTYKFLKFGISLAGCLMRTQWSLILTRVLSPALITWSVKNYLMLLCAEYKRKLCKMWIEVADNVRVDLVNFFGLPRLPRKYAPVAPETLKHDLMSQITGPMCLISCVEAITP